MMSVLYITSLFLAFVTVSTSAFVEQPTTVLAASGTQAEFRCRHGDANVIIGWQVNGTSIGQLKDPNVILRRIRDESDQLVDILTILALPQYNNTEVQCVAIILVPNITRELTPVAILIIQDGFNHSTVTAFEGNDGFAEVPVSIIAAIGTEATFRCQHDDAHVIDWNVNGSSLGNFIPPNVTQSTLSSPGGFVHTLSILALERYNETSVECVAITFLDESRINQRRQETSSVLLLIQGRLTAIKNFAKMNFSLTWSPPFSLDLTSTDPDIVYCVDIYNNSCTSSRALIVSNCSIEGSVYPYNSPQDTNLLEYVVTPRSNAGGIINGTPSVLKEKYSTFNASNLVIIISKSSESQTDVMLSLKYYFGLTDNLQKILHSYSVRLESVDSGQPATREYVAFRNERGEGEIVLQITNSSVQCGRIWYCIVTPATCRDVPLSDNTEISTHDIQNISVSATSSSNSIIISSDFINGSRATGVFTIAYSLTEDSDIYYSVNTHFEDHETLVAELNGLPGSKYNISVFALVDGLPFTRAAARSISVSKMKGVVATKQSSSIYNCLLTEDGTSDDSNTCISCSLTNTNVGTCAVIVHTKPSLLRNSFRGLQDVSVTLLNKSAVDATCSGCIGGVSLSEHVIVAFSYLNGTIVSGSHVLIHRQSSSDTGGGSFMRTWVFRIVIPSVGGVIIIVFVVVLIISVVIYSITKQGRDSQNDKRIKVKRCPAYEVTKVELALEENPSYEEMKTFEQSINMNRCTAYEITKLAREALPLEQNPAYGEVRST